MSETILTREQVESFKDKAGQNWSAIGGWPEVKMIAQSHLATLDALDAALERERVLRENLRAVVEDVETLGNVWDDQAFCMGCAGERVGILRNTADSAWEAALAAVATPQGQEVPREDR